MSLVSDSRCNSPCGWNCAKVCVPLLTFVLSNHRFDLQRTKSRTWRYVQKQRGQPSPCHQTPFLIIRLLPACLSSQDAQDEIQEELEDEKDERDEDDDEDEVSSSCVERLRYPVSTP